MPPTSIPQSKLNNSQLLVSVRNLEEAKVCRRAGVDWIDLKEPSAGSLGMPDLTVARVVAEYLNDFPQRSVALGELVTLDRAAANSLSQMFPVVKVGLSQVDATHPWQEQLDELAQQLDAQLVPVAYADWSDCQAPEPSAVLEWACQHNSQFLLIDTYHKNGKRLLDHLSSSQIEQIVATAQQHDVQVVLAGSLSQQQAQRLVHLPCAAIAIRGAVCRRDRTASIDEGLVQQWVEMLRHRTAPVEI